MLLLRCCIATNCPQLPGSALGKLGWNWESYGDDVSTNKHVWPLPNREVVFSKQFKMLHFPLSKTRSVASSVWPWITLGELIIHFPMPPIMWSQLVHKLSAESETIVPTEPQGDQEWGASLRAPWWERAVGAEGLLLGGAELLTQALKNREMDTHRGSAACAVTQPTGDRTGTWDGQEHQPLLASFAYWPCGLEHVSTPLLLHL